MVHSVNLEDAVNRENGADGQYDISDILADIHLKLILDRINGMNIPDSKKKDILGKLVVYLQKADMNINSQ